MRYQTSTQYTEPLHQDAALEIEHTDHRGITHRWRLPAVLEFGTGRYTWHPVAFRQPHNGEYYVSGAIPRAYQNHGGPMTSRYLIAEPVRRVTLASYYIPEPEPCIHCGAPIDQDGRGHEDGCSYLDE